jgi:hypothetical protein
MEDVPQLSVEERWVETNRVFNQMILKVIRAIEEKFGKEGREVVAHALYEVGREIGNRLRQELNISGAEPIDYARLHYFQDTNYWAIKEEVIPGKSGEVVIRVTYCPGQGIFSARDCATFLPYVRGLMDVINPGLKWTATQVLTRGDSCCEFIVTRE